MDIRWMISNTSCKDSPVFLSKTSNYFPREAFVGSPLLLKPPLSKSPKSRNVNLRSSPLGMDWTDLSFPSGRSLPRKGILIAENQLLYAVVHKENQEGQTRLQCRWMDDLTKADETMIQACDTAFDAAKQQAKMAELRERNRKEKGDKQLRMQR